MNIIETHIVSEKQERIRIQEYAVNIFDSISTKSALKKAIKQNRVLLNGEVSHTADFIKIGDEIALLQKKTIHKKPYYLDFQIIFEDDFLAIVNKPSGISVSGNKFATMANALPNQLLSSVQSDAIMPYPVHRLDYPTSGLLLVAKTASTQRLLHTIFEDRKIEKTYFAVAIGKMDSHSGEINHPIENKSAITKYKVIKSLKSERFEFLNLVELKPITGRTHQLRKHLFYLGNPIMGDKQYFLPEKIHKGNGLYLHAKSLRFKHPKTNEVIFCDSDLPKKFKRLFIPNY